MSRYFLVDCNNFFVSCERVFNPTLRNKPIVVLSSNDACIIARSNEAKKLGIPMGAPLFEYESLIIKHKVIVYSANFALYGDMSSRIMQTLTELSSDIELYSIDEAFLHINEYTDSRIGDKKNYYTAYGHYMKMHVKQQTGIPVSIGIGPTKTLAKVANWYAKKKPEYGSVCDITENVTEYLKDFAIEEVWGIGRRYSKMLKNQGIKTAYDFTQLDDRWVRKKMTVQGLKTLHELRGIVCSELQFETDPKQSICVSRLFGHKTANLQSIKQALAWYVSTAAEKLRTQNSCAGHITVFVLTNKHHDPLNYFASTAVQLPLVTSFTPTLIEAALECLTKIYRPDITYKKVGVILSDIVPASSVQLSTVVHAPDSKKEGEVMEIMDKLNARWGRKTVFFAAAGTEQSWKMKQTRKSPCFTTSWHELLTITL